MTAKLNVAAATNRTVIHWLLERNRRAIHPDSRAATTGNMPVLIIPRAAMYVSFIEKVD